MYMLPIDNRTRLAMWLVAREKDSKKGSCNDFATKDADTAMRLARSSDPDVPTRPKTTTHYVFIPGPDTFVLAGLKTHSAKNVDGITHYFSYVNLWTHRATERPRYIARVNPLEWWEQDVMPVTPPFAHCVVSDSSGPRRMVWYNYFGPENSLLQDLKRKASSQEGRESTLKFMRREALPPQRREALPPHPVHPVEGLIETKLEAEPKDSGEWPARVLKPSSSPYDLCG